MTRLLHFWPSGAQRDQLDPILDVCVAVDLAQLDEDGQVDLKGKAFVRTYDVLASILPYPNAAWDKRSTLLNLLIPKLPAPKEEDLPKGILELIDMDSYRVDAELPHAASVRSVTKGAGGVGIEACEFPGRRGLVAVARVLDGRRQGQGDRRALPPHRRRGSGR